jgi:hypothetical protein
MMSRIERFNRNSSAENEWNLGELHALGVYPAGFGDVEAFQLAQSILGVKADGFFGPLSVAALRRHLAPPSQGGRIIVAHERGWGLKRQGKAPGGVVAAMVHHSVTRSAAGMLMVLKSRRLSTNYSIQPDGTITEHCDPDLMTAHAGAWNRGTVGIDMINPCEPKLWRAHEAWAAPVPTGGSWGARHGLLRRRSVIPDTPAAVDSLGWLLGVLCERYRLGEVRYPAPGLRLQLNPRSGAQEWSVLAHATVDTNRWDGWGALKSLAKSSH